MKIGINKAHVQPQSTTVFSPNQITSQSQGFTVNVELDFMNSKDLKILSSTIDLNLLNSG